MAKFFFHFFDGTDRCEDEWGLEFAGPEQAYLEAVAAARAMLPDLLASRTDPMGCIFDIEDANGEHLFRFEFSELLDGHNGSTVRPAHAREALINRLRETHRRANDAKNSLRSSFDEVYKSLGESSALLARIAEFERWPSRGGGPVLMPRGAGRRG